MTSCNKNSCIAFFALCLLVFNSTLKAQCCIAFKYDPASFIAGKTTAVNAFISNQSGKAVAYRLNVYCPFQVINKIPVTISLQPNDTFLLPLNIYIPRKSKADSVYTLLLKLAGEDSSAFIEKAIPIYLKEDKNVLMTSLNPQIYLYSADNFITVDLKCSNLGNSSQAVHIEISDPLNERNQTIISFILESFTDTIMHIHHTLSFGNVKNSAGHRQIKVSAAYADNNLFSTFFIDLFNVANQKILLTDDNISGYTSPANMLGVYAKYLGSTYHYYEGLANGDLAISPGRKLYYNADILYYPVFSNNQIILTNTYLNYSLGEINMQLGSVYENLEMNLTGRGIIMRSNARVSSKFQAGYINGNYNVTGSFKNNAYQSSDALFATYSAKLDKSKIMDLQCIQYWDPQYKVKSSIAGGTIQFRFSSGKHEIKTGAYINYNTSSSYSERSLSNWGGAATIMYTGKIHNWQIESSNYWSTKTYAGYQKGSLNLNERITHSLNKNLQSWAGFNKRNSNPEYLVPDFSFQNSKYHIETAEIGITASIHQKISASVKPYYYNEFNQYYFSFFANGLSLEAVRINIAATWNGDLNQNFSVNLDGGWSKSSLIAYEHFFGWKINMNYQVKHFSINTVVQDQPFYAGELSLVSLTGKKFHQFVVNPAYYLFLFHKKAFLNINDYVTYENGRNEWINSLMIKGTMSLPHGFLLDASFTTMKYAFVQNTSTFNTGIVKKIGRTAAASNNFLELFLFNDDNANDHYDKGERPAQKALIKVNNDIFQTGNDGKLLYKNIPNGNYIVTVVQGNGYFANEQPVFVTGKTKIEMPLHKMCALGGKIVLQSGEYNYATNESIEAIKIIVTDNKGKTYTAYTNESGNFLFYVPENNYKVQLLTETMQDKYQCADPIKNVIVSTNTAAAVLFKIQIKQRQINIKKFSSLQ